MAGYGAFVSMAKKGGIIAGLSESFSGILSNGALATALVIIVLAFAVYVSYGLSVAFYSKREF